MLTCKETSALISVQYDRRLGLAEGIFMHLHIMMCRYCRAVARRVALIQRLIGLRPNTDLSFCSNTRLPDRIREKITKKVIQAVSDNAAGKMAP